MFRKAETKDIDQIVELLKSAKRRMAEDNLEQWANGEEGYPNREIVVSDIEKQEMYVIDLDGDIAAVCAINDDFYESYPVKIEKQDARTIHRVAVNQNYLGQGIGKQIYANAEQTIKQMGYNTAVVDTYTMNIKMCNLIKVCNYTELGEFQLFDDLPNWVMFKKEL
ncbi:GNAT family N-acetyltransferase [Mollicutes bacterium LVI A0078]|nr:GNAT family N-acetyltransferase [Mollicutes bacterium LVI A0075]WOO91013.1 GNAT family N-acetyltransferase [Mollicutes bacterium LVI A0078]